MEEQEGSFSLASAVESIKSVLSVCLSVSELSHDRTVWHRITVLGFLDMKWVQEGLSGKKTDKEGTTREGPQSSSVFF